MTITGTDTIISSLGTTINTPAFDGDFFIAPDESYIIISAGETPTYESELWISFRKADKSWSRPRKYLFYTRGTGEQDCNIYWVRFDTLLNGLKKERMD